MILIAYDLYELKFGKLMEIYDDCIRQNAKRIYSHMDKNAAVLCAEQDFYSYLSECFFKTKGAVYCVLAEGERYISALRLEPYEDGLLLEALETAPDLRGRGYGKRLVRGVLDQFRGPIYSHVSKVNVPSLRVHRACGFEVISDSAALIDGSISGSSYTMRHL